MSRKLVPSKILKDFKSVKERAIRLNLSQDLNNRIISVYQQFEIEIRNKGLLPVVNLSAQELINENEEKSVSL